LKKKALTLLLVVVIAVLAYLYTLPPTTVLGIDSVYNVTEVGQTVLLNATLSNVPACGEWVLALAWNPYIAQITTGVPNGTVPAAGGPPAAIFEGPFMKDVAPTHFIINYLDNENGTAVFGCLFVTYGTQASGSGLIFTMNFTIIHAGITTVEIQPPFTTENQSLVLTGQNHYVGHAEVNGLITDQGPPPTWTNAGFQETIIASEILVLAASSSVVYWRTHRRPPKSERRKAELQPVVEPEDQT
jgi:hypothetical protein